MANKVQMMDKIARNLDMLKIAYSRNVNSVIVENGSNDLVVSYVDADIQKPMGGVDGDVNPFLGMGIASPGLIKITGAGISTANPGTVGELLNSEIAINVFHLVSGFANSINLSNANAGAGTDLNLIIEGHQDLKMMGQ